LLLYKNYLVWFWTDSCLKYRS